MNLHVVSLLLSPLHLSAALSIFVSVAGAAGTNVSVIEQPASYPDGRPAPRYRLAAKDAGVVLRHGDGPGECDVLGARDVWVWQHAGSYYMHYDGAGPKGWLACLATSKDLVHWTKRGAVLALGSPEAPDSASASYGVTFFDGADWHLFYMGTPHTSGAPELVPAFPYLTLKARGPSPSGPWTKQPKTIPFRPKPDSYYSSTASPGHVIAHGDGYLMVFSAATDKQPTLRTLGLARTKDLNGPWTIDPEPIFPLTEQVENASLYHDTVAGTWWLFTNHVGLRDRMEYTDAIWAYWTNDPEHWDPAHKAVVLDGENGWSRRIIGLPSVVPVGGRLALFYDGNAEEPMPRGVKSHMRRDIGLAWLELPLVPPSSK